jgi:transposase InsO family protein
MDRLSNELKITVRHSRPRHPQANCQIERFNQTLTRYLQKLVFDVDNKDQVSEKNKVWLPHLNKVQYLRIGRNTAQQKRRRSVYFLVFLGLTQ